MINIMFWNAGAGKFKNHIKDKVKIDECICSMIVEYKCDIIVLAEYEYDLEPLCNKISIYNFGGICMPPFLCRKRND